MPTTKVVIFLLLLLVTYLAQSAHHFIASTDPNLVGDPRVSVHHYPQHARTVYYATTPAPPSDNDESLQELAVVVQRQQQHQHHPQAPHQSLGLAASRRSGGNHHHQHSGNSDINNQIGKPIVSPETTHMRQYKQLQVPIHTTTTTTTTANTGRQQTARSHNKKLAQAAAAQQHSTALTPKTIAQPAPVAGASHVMKSHDDTINSIINVYNNATNRSQATLADNSQQQQQQQSRCVTFALDANPMSNVYFDEMIIRNIDNEPCYILGFSAYIIVKDRYFPLKNYKAQVSQTCWQTNDVILIDVDCGYLKIMMRKINQPGAAVGLLLLETISFVAAIPAIAPATTASVVEHETIIYTSAKSTMVPILVTPLKSKFVCDKTVVLAGEKAFTKLVIQRLELQAIATYNLAEPLTKPSGSQAEQQQQFSSDHEAATMSPTRVERSTPVERCPITGELPSNGFYGNLSNDQVRQRLLIPTTTTTSAMMMHQQQSYVASSSSSPRPSALSASASAVTLALAAGAAAAAAIAISSQTNLPVNNNNNNIITTIIFSTSITILYSIASSSC